MIFYLVNFAQNSCEIHVIFLFRRKARNRRSIVKNVEKRIPFPEEHLESNLITYFRKGNKVKNVRRESLACKTLCSYGDKAGNKSACSKWHLPTANNKRISNKRISS